MEEESVYLGLVTTTVVPSEEHMAESVKYLQSGCVVQYGPSHPGHGRLDIVLDGNVADVQSPGDAGGNVFIPNCNASSQIRLRWGQ